MISSQNSAMLRSASNAMHFISARLNSLLLLRYARQLSRRAVLFCSRIGSVTGMYDGIVESRRFWVVGLGCDQRTRLVRCGVVVLLGWRLKSSNALLDSVVGSSVALIWCSPRDKD